MAQLLKETEVAEILQLSVGTIQNWRVLHKGPKYLKLGGTIRYRQEDVEEWIESSLKDPAVRPEKPAAHKASATPPLFSRPSRFGGHKTKGRREMIE